MTTEYLGVKQVAERLGVANAAVYDLPEPDVRIGRTRGWLPENDSGLPLFHGCLRRDSNPRPRSRKEENPIKTRGRYDLPLTKAWTGGLSITASRKRGIGLPAAVGVCPL